MDTTSLIDELVDIVSGKNASVKRTLAAEILKYVAQKRAENEAKSDYALHQVAYHMILDNDVEALWKHDEPKYGCSTTFHLETVKGQDGVGKLGIVKVSKSAEVPEPAPVPAPTFEPAVSLPVLPPSDVEKHAVKESSLTFYERYSPGGRCCQSRRD